MKKNRILILLMVVFACIFFELKALFYSQEFAQHRAFNAFEKYVTTIEKLNPENFDGPRKTVVGGSPWAFEWTYNGDHRLIVGVTLSYSGYAETYVEKDE